MDPKLNVDEAPNAGAAPPEEPNAGGAEVLLVLLPNAGVELLPKGEGAAPAKVLAAVVLELRAGVAAKIERQNLKRIHCKHYN